MTTTKNIQKMNATFTSLTSNGQAVISTIDADDTYTEIARLDVADLGTIAPDDHDQDDIMDGLNDAIDGIAAARGLKVTGSDGDSENFFWTVEVA